MEKENFSPKEVLSMTLANGVNKTKLKTRAQFFLGVLAGMYIAFGGVSSTIVNNLGKGFNPQITKRPVLPPPTSSPLCPPGVLQKHTKQGGPKGKKKKKERGGEHPPTKKKGGGREKKKKKNTPHFNNISPKKQSVQHVKRESTKGE